MGHQEYIRNFRENTGRLPSQVELSKALKISSQAAIKLLMEATRITEKPKTVEEKPKVRVTKVTVLKGGLFLVSGFTFILSVYFTGLWFRTMFHFIVAGLISVSMVTYMVLSPQVVRYATGFVKVPLFLSFLIALVFSMGSTIAGQYDKLSASVDLKGAQDRTVYDLLLQEERDLVAAIEEYRAEKAFHMETMQNLGNTEEKRKENYGYISTERRKVEEYNTKIAEAEAKLSQVREELKEEALGGNTGVVEEQDDFFTWISGILRADKTMVQFWIYTLPAVFIDAIAAICLNLALFIKEKDLPE